MANRRIEIKCPFCDEIWMDEASDEDFDGVRRKGKMVIGAHLVQHHSDRILDAMVMLSHSFPEFVRACMDGTRREGRALTDLQKAANELRR